MSIHTHIRVHHVYKYTVMKYIIYIKYIFIITHCIHMEQKVLTLYNW